MTQLLQEKNNFHPTTSPVGKFTFKQLFHISNHVTLVDQQMPDKLILCASCQPAPSIKFRLMKRKITRNYSPIWGELDCHAAYFSFPT